jgi:hypothetical protein
MSGRRPKVINASRTFHPVWLRPRSAQFLPLLLFRTFPASAVRAKKKQSLQPPEFPYSPPQKTHTAMVLLLEQPKSADSKAYPEKLFFLICVQAAFSNRSPNLVQKQKAGKDCRLYRPTYSAITQLFLKERGKLLRSRCAEVRVASSETCW